MSHGIHGDVRMLTEKQLKAIKSINGSEMLLSDSPHLKLRIYKASNGQLTFNWIYRYKIKNKLYKLRIGAYPEVSLSEARAACAELDVKLQGSNEPLQPIIKRNIQTVKGNTVRILFNQFMEFKKFSIAESTMKKILKVYKAEISKLDDLSITEIEPSIIMQTIINRLIEENSLDYARYIANLLCRFCEYCIDIGELKTNKLTRLNRVVPKFKARHQPSLNPDNLEQELKNLITMINTKSVHIRCLFFISLLTLLRPSEVVNIKVNNIDFDKKIIFIEKTKTMEGFSVPISTYLEDFLKLQMEIKFIDNDYLFSAQTINGHTSSDTLGKLLRTNGYRDKLVSHGIRSIGRNWMAFHEDKIPFSVAEMCLSHVVGNQVTRAYFRTDLLEERRKAMNLWSEYISSL